MPDTEPTAPGPLAVTPPPGAIKRLVQEGKVDQQRARPLIGGVTLTSKDSNAAGTLGCLLWDKKNVDAGFALTAFHVVKPPDIREAVKNKTKLGQPKGTDGSTGYGNDIIGVYAEGDKVVNAGATFADRDEAAVRLSPGMKWKPEIAEIGTITGLHEIAQSEITPGPCRVRKRGAATGLTGGVVIAFVTNAATEPDPEKQHGLIIVRPNPNPQARPDDQVLFATDGDSGSAVVNDANEVVALVHHVAKDTGLTHCTPIKQILDRFTKRKLDLDVAHPLTGHPPVFTVPGGARIALPPEVLAQFAADPGMRRGFRGDGDHAPVGQSWFTDVPPPAGTFERLRDDLRSSASGRLLVGFMERHGPELTRLPYQDQRFRLAWHRGGGSMITQLLLRMLLHPEQTLPATLTGVPVMTCVDRIIAELHRCASPAALADLAEVRAAIPDLAGLSYQGIIDALANASPKADSDGTEGAGH
jgi:hypothetical protein